MIGESISPLVYGITVYGSIDLLTYRFIDLLREMKWATLGMWC